MKPTQHHPLFDTKALVERNGNDVDNRRTLIILFLCHNQRGGDYDA